MKKIVFCLQWMSLGGVEKELISVLKKINNDYDITLLILFIENKELLKEIPKNVKVHIIQIDKDYYLGGVGKLIKIRFLRGKIWEAVTLGIKRLLRIGTTLSNTNIKYIPSLDDSFDIAICYHIHSPLLLKYVIEKVNANKKIAWIHSDFYTTGYKIQRMRKIVCKYDEFVSVSRRVEEEFRSLCPWYYGGISTAHNYLDANNIIKLSQKKILDECFENQKSVKILTVGRFVKEKRIELAIKITSILKKAKLSFHWYVIGYGELEKMYRELIELYDVSDFFTILGKKDNPYPYIKNCDIYVQPSKNEAYCLAIIEAKILCKPIVCTNFAGADEQIENGINGIITEVNDLDGLCNAISSLICSPEKRDILSSKLEKWCSEDNLVEIVKHFNN